ncbi:MAG: T9SS type A sorting domain-containing protein [Bacteroidetes bacterium]|nr:T9SS type A sorting domain-containing protein [Bacteroidota bacterium]
MATGIVNVMPTYWYYACRTYFNQNGYANACANGINSNASVPLSAQGYQIPHSGNGYVIVDYLFSNRTYLQTKLRDSLQKNKKYYCEFYIVKWEDLQVSCNNHGMLFTKNAIYPDTVVNTCGPLNIVPQILPYGNPIISDTMNWIKINGIYKAQGGEQYITIGNHATTSNTSYIRNYPSANTYMAKYLIDDVSVIPLDSMCLKADAGRDTTIKVGDSVFIGSYTNGIDTIKWYNAAGQVIDSTRPGFWVKPSATGTTMYIVEQTVNGCYSRDTVYINAVLPLNFINYNVISTKEKSVENIWTTANEINVSHFNIQRSLNAKDFTTIGKVKAENKVLNNYTFTDDKLPITNEPLTLYYRLQSVDNDGRKQYSTVKSLQLKVNSAVSVYPNPAKDLVNISCIGIKEVNVINSLGQTIIHRNLNNNHYQLDISSLPKGIYVLNVISKLNSVYNEKLIVQ